MAIHLVINKQINLSIYASTQKILIPRRFAKRCTPLVHAKRALRPAVPEMDCNVCQKKIYSSLSSLHTVNNKHTRPAKTYNDTDSNILLIYSKICS